MLKLFYLFRVHKKSKHEGIRYPCNECEYAAIQVADLKRHKKRKHVTVK